MNFFNKYRDLFGVPQVEMQVIRTPRFLSIDCPPIVVYLYSQVLCQPIGKVLASIPKLGI